jgi:hypothetical protein
MYLHAKSIDYVYSAHDLYHAAFEALAKAQSPYYNKTQVLAIVETLAMAQSSYRGEVSQLAKRLASELVV